ncbi:hypothetical protein [Pseudomonas sp. REB1044]|uniref:hypothetical protein n=1 Tax=Pseudomonas sp. REB1044 TaxID=2675224 RepID=UPI00315DFE99
MTITLQACGLAFIHASGRLIYNSAGFQVFPMNRNDRCAVHRPFKTDAREVTGDPFSFSCEIYRDIFRSAM